MRCLKPRCSGRLLVTHTYPTARAKYQRAVCERCGAVHRLDVTPALVERRGEGARARARRDREAGS